ncbi:MAG: hypothetical protein ACR2LF_01945 [Jatrophihabitantaceae bacterium]
MRAARSTAAMTPAAVHSSRRRRSVVNEQYTVWDLQGRPAETVRIVGGEITEIDWR